MEGACGWCFQCQRGQSQDFHNYPEGILLEHSFRLGFNASNNEVEYEVLLAGLRAVSRLEAQDVEVYSDSRLIVNQV